MERAARNGSIIAKILAAYMKAFGLGTEPSLKALINLGKDKQVATFMKRQNVL